MLKVFGICGSEKYAANVAYHLDVPLSKHVEKHFEDGEVYIRSDENVRGADVFVICSFYGEKGMSIGEKLTTLLIFIGSLRDASARKINVVCPLLPFSRQDRKTESRAPITTKYIAELFESVGTSRLLTMDVHSLGAVQNSWRIPVDNLEARGLILNYVSGVDYEGNKVDTFKPCSRDIVCLSPDAGGMSRTKWFARALEKRLTKRDGVSTSVPLAYFDKERVDGNAKGSVIIGDVKGKQVVLFDDMIASGQTMRLAADAVGRFGGEILACCATHPVFTGNFIGNLKDMPWILTTNTIPVKEGLGNVQIISTEKMFASAIRRIYEGGSISDLLQT